jgi:hypothetical protein
MTNLAGLIALKATDHLACNGLCFFLPTPLYFFILPMVSLAVYNMYSHLLSQLFLNLCLWVNIWKCGLILLSPAGILWVLVSCICVSCWSSVRQHYAGILFCVYMLFRACLCSLLCILVSLVGHIHPYVGLFIYVCVCIYIYSVCVCVFRQGSTL